jgi:lipopolysaccharide biosynthesis protein
MKKKAATKERKIVAFHLPQFHPTDENNEWWGQGFTEWTNVTKARPLFRGHYQPHLPTDTGFYDLRLKEARHLQAEMAAEYGVDAFCFYHYWFNGRRLLNRPVDEILIDKSYKHPFLLCWANENWTRNWSGLNKQILMEQSHSVEDDRAHIEFLLKIFRDERYLRKSGKPIFIIYRPDLIPNISKFTRFFRERAKEIDSIEVYLIAVKNNFCPYSIKELTEDCGFDKVLEFQPSNSILPRISNINMIRNYAFRILNHLYSKIKGSKDKLFVRPIYAVHSYEKLVNNAVWDLSRKADHGISVIPCVIPSWDNTSRRRDYIRVIQNKSPELYKKWLSAALTYSIKDEDGDFVFINAWNEWAEGCHLEPDRVVGRGFLKATFSAKKELMSKKSD